MNLLNFFMFSFFPGNLSFEEERARLYITSVMLNPFKGKRITSESVAVVDRNTQL